MAVETSRELVSKQRLRIRSSETHVLGTTIFHEEAGEGPVLVLLHGLNDSHRSFRPVLAELAERHRVLVPDLPGCGLSGRPDACYSLDWQARVMTAWLDALGIDTFDLVGHSYGGGVAQYMLLFAAERVRRLVLVAAGGLGRDVSFELRLASLPRVVETFGQPFMGPVAGRALRAVGGVLAPEHIAWMGEVNRRPGTARAFARTVRDVIDWRGQRRNFLDRAREVKTFPPIALFWGTKDRVIPHVHARRTLANMVGAQLSLFEGCGHFPHQQCPGAFVRALERFLDDPRVQNARYVEQAAPVRDAPLRNAFASLRNAFAPGARTEAALT